MNKDKIVLFDIDYTLFDVSYFHKEFYKKLSKIINIDENKIRKAMVIIISDVIKKDGYLDIDKCINSTLRVLNKENYKNEAENLLFKSGFFKKGFYREVGRTLKALKQFTKIGIFSHGDYKFQWAKIEQSGFKDYFDKDITYIRNIKMDFLPILRKNHLNDKLYLIDDKPNVIDDVKKFMPGVFTIWIKRGEFIDRAKEIDDFSPDATVNNLSEVVEIVKKN